MNRLKTTLAAVALLLISGLMASAQSYWITDYGVLTNIQGSNGYSATYYDYGNGFGHYQVWNPGGSYPYCQY